MDFGLRVVDPWVRGRFGSVTSVATATCTSSSSFVGGIRVVVVIIIGIAVLGVVGRGFCTASRV